VKKKRKGPKGPNPLSVKKKATSILQMAPKGSEKGKGKGKEQPMNVHGSNASQPNVGDKRRREENEAGDDKPVVVGESSAARRRKRRRKAAAAATTVLS